MEVTQTPDLSCVNRTFLASEGVPFVDFGSSPSAPGRDPSARAPPPTRGPESTGISPVLPGGVTGPWKVGGHDTTRAGRCGSVYGRVYKEGLGVKSRPRGRVDEIPGTLTAGLPQCSTSKRRRGSTRGSHPGPSGRRRPRGRGGEGLPPFLDVWTRVP